MRKLFERFCSISRYRDGTTGEVYRAQVALQLLVKPGSYRAGHSHRDMDANELLDQNLGTENLEWYLENQGSVVLTTLLIKIEPTWRRCHPRSPNVDPMSWFQRCVVLSVCWNQNFPFTITDQNGWFPHPFFIGFGLRRKTGMHWCTLLFSVTCSYLSVWLIKRRFSIPLSLSSPSPFPLPPTFRRKKSGFLLWGDLD